MAKDKFEDIDDKEYQDKVAGMNTDQIRVELSKLSLDQMELMEAKEADQDLEEKAQAASDAGAIYRDGTKQNKLKSLFCKQVLGDKGGC